jgi:hypothetical protein
MVWQQKACHRICLSSAERSALGFPGTVEIEASSIVVRIGVPPSNASCPSKGIEPIRWGTAVARPEFCNKPAEAAAVAAAMKVLRLTPPLLRCEVAILLCRLLSIVPSRLIWNTKPCYWGPYYL